MLTPGHHLDRYELLCPIASGGMATVWLARLRGKRGFVKLVAIKTIKTELITDPRYQEMFLDEARIASGIEHPNVAQILDLGEADDNLYLVMEWVDGESLAKICRLANKRKKPLPLKLALRIMADACAGLHAAHELKSQEGDLLNVVHRDVSPHNILVTGGGAAKVIDFGVAKAASRGAADTQSGVVKGKIRYMAPEQVNSQNIDRRADLWAIGMCLHELVIGKPPYDDLGDIDVVRRLMTANPEPELDDSHPPALRKVLARSLVKDPDARYPTAAAMRRGIESALDELGVSPTSEDVADFINDVLPELAEWRKRTVTKAISAAQNRNSGAPDLRATDRPTMPVPSGGSSPSKEFRIESANADDIAEVALTRRKTAPPPRRGSTPPAGAVSTSSRQISDRPDRRDKTTGGATLTEQLGQRPRSKVPSVFFGAVVALSLFATFVWPGVDRLRSMAASESPPPSAEPSANSLPPSASAIELEPTPPSASASASASAPAPETSTSAVPSATVAPAATTTTVAPRPLPRPIDPSQQPSDPAALAAAAAAAEASLRGDAGSSANAPAATTPPTPTTSAPPPPSSPPFPTVAPSPTTTEMPAPTPAP